MSNDIDKYKLIYQFNNDSPLFVRIAQDHIENLNFEEAKKILEQGMKIFPDYITAQILYGVCLAELKQFDEAKKIITKAALLLDSDETLEFYLKKISEITGITENSEVLNDNENSEDELSDNNPLEITEENAELSENEDDLESLAKKLENAKLELNNDFNSLEEFIPQEENQNNVESGKSLVSETLAKIYLSQGNYEEALSLYKNLVEIQPERSQFYLSQINYIQEIIGKNKK